MLADSDALADADFGRTVDADLRCACAAVIPDALVDADSEALCLLVLTHLLMPTQRRLLKADSEAPAC